MTKPFAPRKPRLFYLADGYVEEDIYMSEGRYRRYLLECRRINKPGGRKHIKHIRMMLRKVGIVPSPVHVMREKAKEVF